LHKKGQTFENAIGKISDCSGSQFDPEVIEAFLVACEKNKTEWPLSNCDSSITSTQEHVLIKN
jgi:HD-GYP domain-containing protein (c-di-GMP phosphodiesterase class II)